MDSKQTKLKGKREPKKIDIANCKICKGEYAVLEFKDHCICEACVVYIRKNF